MSAQSESRLDKSPDDLRPGGVVARTAAPSVYHPRLVRETRDLLAASQAVFARFLGVSVQTVRAWEQGVNTPSTLASRFLDEIRHDPAYWRTRLRETVVLAAAQ